MRFGLLFTLALAACTSTPADPAASSHSDLAKHVDMTIHSDCGHPGDKGNALGVGMFCDTLDACSNNTKATLCTILGDSTNFFCTFRCDANGAPNQCGDGARCACDTGGCGCFPTACDPPGDMAMSGEDAHGG